MTELEKERRALEDLQVSRATAQRLDNENAGLRGELRELSTQLQAAHEGLVELSAAKLRSRILLDENQALKMELAALTTKEHGWPWALEQLAAGHKVTHPILSSDPDHPGWIEKLGTGPRGAIYDIHESYCYSRVLGGESGWAAIASKARQSIGWRVMK